MNKLQRKDKLKRYIGNFSIHIFKPVVVLFIISTYSCTSVKESIIYQEFMPTYQSELSYIKTAGQETDTHVIQESDTQENITEVANRSESYEISESASENPVNEQEENIAESVSENPVSEPEKNISESASDNIVNERQENISVSDDIAARQFYKRYSKKFGINFDGAENPELIMAVDEWLDTQFKMGGCSKEGIDCSCLVKDIYKNVYGIELDRTTISMFNDDALIPVKKEDLQEGDLIFFKIKDDAISHVGIYLKDNHFIHASLSMGVIISNLDGKYYRERFVSGKRLPEKRMRFARFYHR